MIYIRLDGHDWQYQVNDIVRLFGSEKKAIYIETDPRSEYRGVFVCSKVSYINDIWTISTQLSQAGKNMYREDYTIYKPKDVDYSCKLKEAKREVKRQLYLVLSKYFNIKLPWGTLTGIRPAKIVNEMMDNNYSKDDVINKLEDYYKVSKDKAALVYEVAKNERPLLNKAVKDTIGLYIGIPFCPSRCLYCSFTSNPISRYAKMVKQYLEALKTEINGVAGIINEKGYKIQSIYIGGGTPTSLDAENLKELLQMIENGFDLTELEEYTLEAGRPDSLNREKFKIINNSRVSRISINPQTMNDETLELIGRNHTSNDIIEAFTMARSEGLKNINMDLILGLPGETVEMFENTLKEIKRLQPESLTVHSLALKRASTLNQNIDKFSIAKANEAEAMVEKALEYARAMDMHPYYLYRQKNMVGDMENIGYCKPGYESIYNVQIMEEKQTIIALGAGAITKVIFPEQDRIERTPNVKGVEEYISRIDEMIERKRALIIDVDGKYSINYKDKFTREEI